jgi:hypothetical protein
MCVYKYSTQQDPHKLVVRGTPIHVPRLLCRDCFSSDIGKYKYVCVECHKKTLYFDDVRFEIVCTGCGLVHAGVGGDINYPFGYLLKRPQ